ncbi:MAG: transglycosylase domain-containing protein [Candidatus Hodarchaeota archaeon]
MSKEYIIIITITLVFIYILLKSKSKAKYYFKLFKKELDNQPEIIQGTFPNIPLRLLPALIFCEEPNFFKNQKEISFCNFVFKYIFRQERGRIIRYIVRIYLYNQIHYIPLLTMLIEIYFSYYIETYCDKLDIFNYFINYSKFDSGVTGFETASRILIGKNMKDTQLNEILYLLSELHYPHYVNFSIYASLTKLKSKHIYYYYKHYRLILKWKNDFLRKLKELNIINDDMYKKFIYNNSEVLSYIFYKQSKESKELKLAEFEDTLSLYLVEKHYQI